MSRDPLVEKALMGLVGVLLIVGGLGIWSLEMVYGGVPDRASAGPTVIELDSAADVTARVSHMWSRASAGFWQGSLDGHSFWLPVFIVAAGAVLLLASLLIRVGYEESDGQRGALPMVEHGEDRVSLGLD